MKSVFILALFFVLFLVLFETPKIKANEDECLKEYISREDEVQVDGYTACTALKVPSLCYRVCTTHRGSKGARCIDGDKDEYDIKCLCDYCTDIDDPSYLTVTATATTTATIDRS